MGDKPIAIQAVTWNLGRRDTSTLRALEKALGRVGRPDLLTLQEITFKQHKAFKEGLGEMGFNCHPDGQRDVGGRRYGNLIASRWPLDPIEPRYSRFPRPTMRVSSRAARCWAQRPQCAECKAHVGRAGGDRAVTAYSPTVLWPWRRVEAARLPPQSKLRP
jgi:hypothetical protein